MNQEKIGKLIKDLRIKNNLTQNDLANILGVTYQAVSKWENGKNIPDIAVLKQISSYFKIDINNLLEGNLSSKNNKNIKNLITLGIILIIVISVMIVFSIKANKDNFEFKTISTTCNSFNITGSMAYNKDKSSIYISNITYCGGNDNTLYKEIKCTLYEENKNSNIKIGTHNYKNSKGITLEDFLHNTKFNIDNYKATCKSYQKSNLYIEIKATTDDEKIIGYNIPLALQENCPK